MRQARSTKAVTACTASTVWNSATQASTLCPMVRLPEKGSMPSRMRASVDFPEPLGPISAILSPRLKRSLAVSGGVHSTEDIIKALMAGAHVVQLVSVLLRHGPRVVASLLAGLTRWLEDHGYESVDQLRGAMNLRRCPDPAAFERANYIRILQSWKV